MGYSANYHEPGAGAGGLSQTVKTLIWAADRAHASSSWRPASTTTGSQTFATPIYLVVLGLLLATMLLGTNLFGAQMSITVAGLDFQFSEISKVLMIVVLAAFLAARGASGSVA